jgi:hypothetical protein
MNVKQLIELLGYLPPESQIILSSDGEGNNFSPLTDYSNGYYFPESSWQGSFFTDEESIKEMEDDGWEGTPAIVLWPVN